MAKKPSPAANKPSNPKPVVVHPGDQVRQPDEIETLERQSPPSPKDEKAPDVQTLLRDLLRQIGNLRLNQQAWKGLSPLQRYAIVGVEVLAQEVLGENDVHGRKASLERTLGLKLSTGRALGHGAA